MHANLTNFVGMLRLGFWLICLLLFSSCSTDVRHADSGEIQAMVSVEAFAASDFRVWTAPELQVSHFRVRFYGYDIVYYRLRAEQGDQQGAAPSYHLLLDANYGGETRHYEMAKTPAGATLFTEHRQHEFVRCQFFGDMVDACLYRDRADIALSRADLETARTQGLSLRLSSSSTEYEQIDLPANYVDGFLRAMQTR
jgi:hypothetical protein